MSKYPSRIYTRITREQECSIGRLADKLESDPSHAVRHILNKFFNKIKCKHENKHTIGKADKLYIIECLDCKSIYKSKNYKG